MTDIVIHGIAWNISVVSAMSQEDFVSDYKGTVYYVPDEDKEAELKHVYTICLEQNTYNTVDVNINTTVPQGEEAPINPESPKEGITQPKKKGAK